MWQCMLEPERLMHSTPSQTWFILKVITRWCRPRGPVLPMYMPGRLRTGSSPSKTCYDFPPCFNLAFKFGAAALINVQVDKPIRSKFLSHRPRLRRSCQYKTWIWPASYAFTDSAAGASLATLHVVINRFPPSPQTCPGLPSTPNEFLPPNPQIHQLHISAS
jgi:hypothetical protein